MTILVRDEELLLDKNLEYHLSRGVDLIIATDNRSVDHTPEILRKYEKRGVLKYISEPADDYSQDRWVTRMARLAAEYGADWVFHVDADEFWWPEKGDSLKEVLSMVPHGVDGLLVQRTNFVYVGDSWKTPFYANQIYREKESLNPLGNRLPPKVCHRGIDNVQIAQGNHFFSIDGKQPSVQATGAFIIFHYPIHCSFQFKRKIQLGGSAYDSNERLRGKAGQTWTSLYYESQSEPAAVDRYLKSKRYSPGDIEQGLETGRLVEDVRLRDYLTALTNE